jgi:uncharacterized protein YcfL
MKHWSTIIILSLLLSSCSFTSENNVIGQWDTESCLIGFIHASVTIQTDEANAVVKNRINTDFSIKFNQDSSFLYNDLDRDTITGKYKLTGKLLSLTINNDSNSWLNFAVDSTTDERLYLSSNSIKFYSTNKDSLNFFTGDKVALIFKRRP